MKSNNLEKPNNWDREIWSVNMSVGKTLATKFSSGMIKIPIKFSLSFQKQNKIGFEIQIGFDWSFILPVQVPKNLPAGAGSKVYSCRCRFLHFGDNKD